MAKLTEQDIINWNGPEDDYMNEDQLAFFRELLVKQTATALPPSPKSGKRRGAATPAARRRQRDY